MLARDLDAPVATVERVQVVQVLEKHFTDLGYQRRGKFLAGGEVMRDLAEDPGAALRRASDHDAVRAGVLENVLRPLRCGDIAVGNHRQPGRRLDLADRVVLGLAGKPAGARAAVQRQQLDAALLGDFRHAQRIPAVAVPSGAEFEGHGNLDGADHRIQNASYQRLIAQQRGAGHGVAYLLCRTAHVDVDDLCAFRDVVASCLGHHSRIGACDLDRNGLDFAIVVGTAPSLFAAPKQGVGRDHFGDCETGAELLAQLAEGAVGDTGHRRDKQIVAQNVGSDLHCRARGLFRAGKEFYNESRAERKQNFAQS